MSLQELFSRLNRQGIRLEVVENNLEIKAPKGKLTPGLIRELREKKQELITFLQSHARDREKYTAVEAVEKKEYYLLSSAQKRIYIIQRMDLDVIAYNMPLFLELEGEFDKDKFTGAFRRLIARHESLRTSFHIPEDEPVQKINEEVEVKFKIEDYEGTRGLAPLPIESATALISSFVRPFDLSKAPLLRVGLMEIGKHRHLLMVDIHHIVADGVSQEVLIKDFISLYQGEELPRLPIQYKDFTRWQNREKEKDVMKKQQEYWKKEFSGEIPVLNLPVDFVRPLEKCFQGSTVDFELSPEETKKLKKLAREEDDTLFMVILAIYNIFLSKICTQEDIIIGTPISGRGHSNLQSIIGMFVNTLAFRDAPNGEKSFKEFLKQLSARTLEAFENRDYQFEDLVEQVAVQREANRNPVFDTMLALENMEISEIKIPGLKLKPYDYQNVSAKFDLMLTAVEAGENLQFTFEYCTGLFKEETVRRFSGFFHKIISAVIGNRGIKISGIEIINEQEKNRILYEFNDTEAEYSRDKTIHRLFEEQVERTPDRVALTGQIPNPKSQIPNKDAPFGQVLNAFGVGHLSYKKLNNQSNRLAGALIEKGVQPDTIVGMMMERTIEMMIGIFGILKAGGAYLPIDAGYPEDRINYMLQDSAAEILLTSDEINRVSTPSHLHLSPASVTEVSSSSTLTSTCRVSSTNLVYVIYTSGSTGKPKGAMVKIKSFINLLDWYRVEFNIDARDNVLLMASVSFDLAQKNLFVPLITGARLCLPFCELNQYDVLSAVIAKEQITITNCAPSVFYPLVEFNLDSDFIKLKSLREVLLGGESIQTDKLRPWINSEICGCEIVNTYGPTECTDIASFYRINREDINRRKNIPIGKPIRNVRLYVLDKNRLILPVGIAGELCIGGISLGKGYCNNEQLTGEKFIETVHLPVKKVYGTGDLTRWLPDGNIELLGRIDHQVKIRGFRIELGEIESQLRSRDEIKEAVVLAKEYKNGEKYLCAYIVLLKVLAIPGLRRYLSGSLPAFMVPTYFVMLDRIPLTPNGKIDHRALPEPDLKEAVVYIAPRNRIEEKLIELWSEVLGVEKSFIGIDTNFFELGGHSLKVNSLLMKIHRAFEVKLPMAEVFKTPRIRELAQCIKGLTKDRYEFIEPAEKKDYYQLSSTQKRLYILQQMESGQTTSYNMPYVIPLEKEIDKNKLASTFTKLIARHESLRTSFELVAGEPVQRIYDSVNFAIHDFGLEVESKNVEEIIATFVRDFDLSRAPLLRVGLIKLSPTSTDLQRSPSYERTGDKYLLLVDMHHIITDDASQNILEQEFWALAAGQELSPLRLHYKDFSGWQNSRERKEAIKQQETFWKREFSHNDQLTVLNLPTDYPRPSVQSFEGSSVQFVLTPRETRSLKDIAKETDLTLFMCLLSIYTILLAKLSGREDIIVGIPIAARRHADMEHIIGMFANTLAMRNYPSGEKTLREFLQEVKARTLKAFENQEYPFEELVEMVPVHRDISRNPIFDVMFNLLNRSELNAAVDMPVVDGQDAHRYEYQRRTAKFDLNLTAVDDNGKSLYFDLEYCTRLFKASTIERMIGYFRRIVVLLSVNPGLKISELEIITEEEKTRVLEMSNGVEEESYVAQTIHRWFEDQVEKSPNSIALVGISHRAQSTTQRLVLYSAISFKELNEKSNRLASVLIERGVTTDAIVGLMMERSVEMIAAILAILKAGGAYLPIDKEYPEKRKRFMLKDSRVKLLLTYHDSEPLQGAPTGEIEILDISDEGIYSRYSSNSKPMSIGTNLLYVIYTSGTTGKPKGVMLEHKNLVNLVSHQYKYTNIDFSRVLQFTTISFDVSAQEIFSTLLAGGQLSIIDKETRNNVTDLFKVVERDEIKTLFLATAFLKFIFKEKDYVGLIPASVKHIVAAGEQLIIGDNLKKYLKENQVYLHNHYGPSETHVVTALTLEPPEEIPDIPSIGKPILNTSIFILDKKQCLLPIGVSGEMYIRGIQVGRGYLDRPQLTAERFIRIVIRHLSLVNSSSEFSPNDRLYKTGDLARWLPDGNIEFLGRKDHQVKIRGYRIELGEIENQLLTHGKIKEAIVIARGDNHDRYLCAYIVMQPGEPNPIDQSVIRGYLSNRLPDYMVPSYFVQLDRIPLTPNGKVDRKSLPAPGIKREKDYVAPRDAVEKKLVGQWSEILGVEKERITIDANFFHMGGHSLKAAVLASRIHKEFNINVPLTVIFKTPHIRGLASYIKEAVKNKHIPVEPVEKKEYYPLSSAQGRLYILQQMDAEKGTAYNMPSVWQVGGHLDVEKFETVFLQLIRRHESLRTFFTVVNDEPVQRIKEEVEVKVEERDQRTGDRPQTTEEKRQTKDNRIQTTGVKTNTYLSSSDVIRHRNMSSEFIRPFDLSRAPLLRVGLIKIDKQKHVLMVDMHHIISDGISVNVLITDFIALYGGKNLPGSRIQYKDFSEWRNSKQQGELIKKQEEYLLNEFKGDLPVLNLPADFERSIVQSFEGGVVGFSIPRKETRLIKKIALEEGATLFMVLLAIYSILLSRLSNQNVVVIGTSAAGRPHIDLEKVLGMFVNTLALKISLGKRKTFKEFLQDVKNKTLEAFDNQDYQFDDLVEKLSPPRVKGRNPIFDVRFTMNNFDTAAVDIPGLTLSPYDYVNNVSKFDMSLLITENGDTLNGRFEYCSKLYKEETIIQFVNYIKEILQLVVENSNMKLESIALTHGFTMPQIDTNGIDLDF